MIAGTRSALECGSLLPLLRLELARGGAGSKLPATESGSKLPHSNAHPCDTADFGRLAQFCLQTFPERVNRNSIKWKCA